MSTVRLLPAQDKRVESGPVQFGDDWPGVFIRGDDAAAYAFELQRMLDAGPSHLDAAALTTLRNALSAAIVGPARDMLPPG